MPTSALTSVGVANEVSGDRHEEVPGEIVPTVLAPSISDDPTTVNGGPEQRDLVTAQRARGDRDRKTAPEKRSDVDIADRAGRQQPDRSSIRDVGTAPSENSVSDQGHH